MLMTQNTMEVFFVESYQAMQRLKIASNRDSSDNSIMKTSERPNLDVLPDHQRSYPWAKLQAWAREFQPDETLICRDSFWKQVMLVRDELCSALGPKNVKEISVASSHMSKSILLPVYRIDLHDGTIIFMRGNFHDWKVTVISKEPILLNTALFDPTKEISGVYCEGFDELWVLDPYSRNNRSFTLEVTNDFVLFALMIQIGRPDPMMKDLISSLERTSNRLRSVLESKPVRDADETLEEARHYIQQAQ